MSCPRCLKVNIVSKKPFASTGMPCLACRLRRKVIDVAISQEWSGIKDASEVRSSAHMGFRLLLLGTRQYEGRAVCACVRSEQAVESICCVAPQEWWAALEASSARWSAARHFVRQALQALPHTFGPTDRLLLHHGSLVADAYVIAPSHLASQLCSPPYMSDFSPACVAPGCTW